LPGDRQAVTVPVRAQGGTPAAPRATRVVVHSVPIAPARAHVDIESGTKNNLLKNE